MIKQHCKQRKDMSRDIAIRIENLGKMYRLGEVGTGTISHDLNRWLAKVRGREDPFAKIGETNDRTSKANSSYVWALKDIDLEIEKGQAVGIIGRNGAGKSTLLKLLSKITQPTTGSIKIDGRIASLLEVGTGFHPEMTGRENIFLNGAIMGMTKREIRSKFDEIVDFAGVERYVDTPVKRYSSGMYVRLAFAVAAHLEPDILIVDEVLAVGDAEFQKKCLGKMKDVSEMEGRTVLFVSHQLNSVQQLCDQCILMKNGSVLDYGDTKNILNAYLADKSSSNSFANINKHIIDGLHIGEVWIEGQDDKMASEVCIGEKWRLVIQINVDRPLKGITFAMGVTSALEIPINTTWTYPLDLNPGLYNVCFHANEILFPTGTHKIVIGIDYGVSNVFYDDSSIQIDFMSFSEKLEGNFKRIDGSTGVILNPFKTEVKFIR